MGFANLNTHYGTESGRVKYAKSSTKGITLVALVVTVVILLILAGVSIGTLFGDHGIIKKAQEAVDKTQEEVEKEQKEFENLLEQLNRLGNTEGGGDTPGKVEMPEGWDERQVTPVKSADNKIVPVPKGFTASEVSRTVGENEEIENTVDGGFVIYQSITDNDEDELNKVNNDNVDSSNARTTRNQFVWVPYSEFMDECPMFTTDSEGNTVSQTYKNRGYSINATSNPTYPPAKDKIYNEYEPGYFEGYELSDFTSAGIEITSVEQIEEQIKNEFEKMKQSIERYGGFYIGRYETGGVNTPTAKVVKGEGDESINKQSWFVQYQRNKEMAVGTGATSSVIWNTQWDATLNWFLKQDATKLSFMDKASGKGHYTTSETGVILTGSNENYIVNNIYDLYGNVGEWTMAPVYHNSTSKWYTRIFNGRFL